MIEDGGQCSLKKIKDPSDFLELFWFQVARKRKI